MWKIILGWIICDFLVSLIPFVCVYLLRVSQFISFNTYDVFKDGDLLILSSTLSAASIGTILTKQVNIDKIYCITSIILCIFIIMATSFIYGAIAYTKYSGISISAAQKKYIFVMSVVALAFTSVSSIFIRI